MSDPIEKNEIEKKWYSLRVISGKEMSIKENIVIECEEKGMGDYLGEVFVPFEKVVQLRNNKKKIKEKMFFPGYILINIGLTNESRYVIENTTGVINFVVEAKWTDLLQLVLITVIGAYFGGRSLEKTKK